MRITIIGLPASGKSALARRISEKFSIPHIHIDKFWFETGGLRVDQGLTSPEEREKIRRRVREKVLEAIRADSWVADGFYHRVQPDISARADVIIFLNIPLTQRLWAHAKRVFRPGRHAELTLWSELRFFVEVIRRTKRRGPAIRQFIDERRDKVVELHSWKEMDDYVADLGALEQ